MGISKRLTKLERSLLRRRNRLLKKSNYWNLYVRSSILLSCSLLFFLTFQKLATVGINIAQQSIAADEMKERVQLALKNVDVVVTVYRELRANQSTRYRERHISAILV
jgi:hypothetical protein